MQSLESNTALKHNQTVTSDSKALPWIGISILSDLEYLINTQISLLIKENDFNLPPFFHLYNF